MEPQVEDEGPRLTTLMGVARALLVTAGPATGARALIEEYGWDATFHVLALLKGDDARDAFGRTWTALLLDDLEAGIAAPTDPRPGPAPLEDGGPGRHRRG